MSRVLISVSRSCRPRHLERGCYFGFRSPTRFTTSTGSASSVAGRRYVSSCQTTSWPEICFSQLTIIYQMIRRNISISYIYTFGNPQIDFQVTCPPVPIIKTPLPFYPPFRQCTTACWYRTLPRGLCRRRSTSPASWAATASPPSPSWSQTPGPSSSRASPSGDLHQVRRD